MACNELAFRRVGTLRLSALAERDCAAHWAVRTRRNPALFDGPITLATGTPEWEGTRCAVSYVESHFSTYVWTRDRNAGMKLGVGSLYASVVPTTADGYVLTGRMAARTSTPARIQLPGGNVEPVDSGLTEPAVRATAVRELAEETGIVLSPTVLTLTHVIAADDSPDLGVLYAASLPTTLQEVEQLFVAHTENVYNEFDRLIAFRVWPGAHRAPPEPSVHYLDSVIAAALGLRPGALSYVETEPLSDAVATFGVDAR